MYNWYSLPFCLPSLNVAGITCDGIGNKGGGGNNLGRRSPRLPLGTVGGKSSLIDMIVPISTGIDSEGGSEKVEGCTEGESKKVGLGGCTEKVKGCTDGGFEKIGGCTKGEFEKVGNCTKKVGGHIDGGSEKTGACIDGGRR